MKKTIVFLTAVILTLCLLSSLAFAEETVFRTTVPDTHTLSIAIYGSGSVFVNGKEYRQSTAVSVPRHRDVQVEIKSDNGWCIQRAEYNSLTLSGQIFSRSVTLPSVNADGTLAVQFGRTVVTGVKTGDETFITLWLGIFLTSAAACALLIGKLKTIRGCLKRRQPLYPISIFCIVENNRTAKSSVSFEYFLCS